MGDGQSGPLEVTGSLRRDEGAGIVRVEALLDIGVDDAWSALTEPARLAHWYGEVDGDLRVGGEYHARVHASGWEGTGRVDACTAPHGFVTTSHDPDEQDAHSTEVTLRTDDGRTRLVVEQRGLPVELLWAYGAGLQLHVEDLADHLAGLERRDAEARWEPLEATYRTLQPTLEVD